MDDGIGSCFLLLVIGDLTLAERAIRAGLDASSSSRDKTHEL